MHEYLHLLVIDRRRRSGLIDILGGRWMLPLVACSGRARAPLAAARWLADRQLTGVVAGQWLGRLTADGRNIDWLLTITTDAPHTHPSLRWASLDCLDPPTAILDYQGWAVTRLTEGGGTHVRGPFGSLDWIDGARAWIESKDLAHPSNPICLRATAHDVVLRLRCESTDVYYKGAAADRASDLHAMAAAAEAWPESFPRTLALQTCAAYTQWLLAGCDGVPFVRSRDCLRAERVASDIGALQWRAAGQKLRSAIPSLSLRDVFRDADRLLERAGLAPLSRTQRCAFDEVLSLPEGWTPLDLDPSNVFVDVTQIRYIDLEPRVTAMPIALSIFARRLSASGESLDRLRRAYESAAGEVIPWPAVDVVSEIVEAVNGWRRVLRNVDCGEVTGPLDGVARAAARRLASAKPLV